MEVNRGFRNIIFIRLGSLNFFQQGIDWAQKFLSKRALKFLARGPVVSRREESFLIGKIKKVSK